jgi:membrane protein
MFKNILSWPVISWPIRVSKKVVLPGFDGLPLYDVTRFFIKGLWEGYIGSRASSISFNFFLAIFPSLIFLFTIIPFVPIENFQQTLLGLIHDLVPRTTYETIRETVEDIVTRPRGGLLSLGFLLTLYFTTNGIHSMMEAFNSTFHSIETRSWFKQRLVSTMIVVIISILLIISIGLMTFGTALLRLILPEEFSASMIYVSLFWLLKWLVILLTLFFTISFMYYFAPAKKRHFRFISAGSTLATILVIITTMGFNFWVDNFGRYNLLYGSIGTLMIVLLWFYFNSFSLLIGFELNASILKAKQGGDI